MCSRRQVVELRGLAHERRDPTDGRARLYHLNREPFAELRGWLDEVEAFLGEQLVALPRYAAAGGPDDLAQ